MTVEKKFKTKLTAAFKLMRKEGLIARQNFSCCGSCGSVEMSTALATKKNEEKIGYCFYHRQDADALYRGSVYLAFGACDEDAVGDDADVKVGAIVALACLKADLKVTWNGSTTVRVLAEANVEV